MHRFPKILLLNQPSNGMRELGERERERGKKWIKRKKKISMGINRTLPVKRGEHRMRNHHLLRYQEKQGR